MSILFLMCFYYYHMLVPASLSFYFSWTWSGKKRPECEGRVSGSFEFVFVYLWKVKLISNSHTTVIEQWRLKSSINESALSLAADGRFSSAAALDGSSERALTHIVELREWCAAGETCVTHFYTSLDVYFAVLMHEVWLTAGSLFR